jgi:GntR family transcriptional regulator, phosphonate transport system regulatory protein
MSSPNSRTGQSKPTVPALAVGPPRVDGASCEAVITEVAPPTPLPQWRVVADEIEDDILNGRLSAGDKLSTEASIAARHGVARQTVRTAIAALSRRGLVRCTPGIGAFIASPRITYSLASDARFYENVLRAGRRPGSRTVSIRQTTAPHEMATWLGVARRTLVREIEHIGTASGVPICRSISWFPEDRCWRLPELFERTGSFSEAFRLIGIARTHRKTARITVCTAGEKDITHLGVAPGASMLVIDALYVDDRGEPVQATHATFPSELVEIVVGS